MVKNVIQIDEEKCVGCGLCVSACHEGAIGLVDGKAKLLQPDYCDGLGRCLPACPVDAISLEKLEVDLRNKCVPDEPESLVCGCPGTHSKNRRP